MVCSRVRPVNVPACHPPAVQALCDNRTHGEACHPVCSEAGAWLAWLCSQAG